MTATLVFIQVQGKPGITEAELPEADEAQDIYVSLKRAGIEIDEEMVIFVDESEHHEERDCKRRVKGLKHGCRLHITHCRRVAVTVHFLDKTMEHKFSPGARVRTVKQWAIHKLKVNATDAGEHILQLCDSTKQPPTDTPLVELVEGCACELCFDLVPEKRVEG